MPPQSKEHAMNVRQSSVPFLFAIGLAAQNVAVFPADYVNVPDGPYNSPNLPLANGTGRGQIVYEQWDLPVPVGSSITRLGFRQDPGTTTMDTGRGLQLEIRMGYTTATSANISTTLDSNFASTPVTVYPTALLQLPNLRDTANPLPDGRFWINLTTPFVYSPAANQNLLVEYRVYGNSAGGSSFNYRIDRADYYSPVVNGPAGCQHSGGSTPTLTLSPTRTGSQFYATIASAPGNSFAVLLMAIGSPLQQPFSLQTYVPGIAAACQGQIAVVGASSLTGFTGSTGSATFYFNIPNVRVPYNDLTVGTQAAFFDLFAPGGLVVSNGAQVEIGIQPQSTIVWGSGPPSTVTTGSQNTRYCPVAFFGWQ
jgi:hypothetical protein